jgi:hypothetical protein
MPVSTVSTKLTSTQQTPAVKAASQAQAEPICLHASVPFSVLSSTSSSANGQYSRTPMRIINCTSPKLTTQHAALLDRKFLFDQGLDFPTFTVDTRRPAQLSVRLLYLLFALISSDDCRLISLKHMTSETDRDRRANMHSFAAVTHITPANEQCLNAKIVPISRSQQLDARKTKRGLRRFDHFR